MSTGPLLTTANGKNVLAATVTLPRVGIWHADLTVDTPTPSDVTGAIALSLVDAQLALSGTSFRVGAWRGLTHVRLAGGADGFGTLLPAQGYSNSPASTIVGDILNGAGEKLSSSAMSLASRMAWARIGGESAGTGLQAIVDELGATWRVLPDGTIWIGAESWPASPLSSFNVSAYYPEDARLELVTTTPLLLPGTTLPAGAGAATYPGGNVGRVVYHVAEGELRVEVFYE